ncbi:MAG: uroporphyrinogen-III synthase [Saprospiraceae bacterium]
MSDNRQMTAPTTYKRIETVLVSQPKPERSPYYSLEEKYGLKIDWRPFIEVKGLPEKLFRKQRIQPDKFTAIIFTSKQAIDHFFRICKDMRTEMPQDTKYFCLTEAVANYLQHFIIYRKRKVFAGKRVIADLAAPLKKHKKESFLLPCNSQGSKFVAAYLDEHGFNWKPAIMYSTVAADLNDLENVTYDVLVFFSPTGIESLYENFPTFQQRDTRLAAFGAKTLEAVEKYGLVADIVPSPPETPSMTMALEKYLKISNK